MPLSRDEVRHVAMLARLGLEPGDEDFYAEQLSGILEHIDRLQQVDTEEIPPTAQVESPPYRLADRKSTRLNSSHVSISYAVFCLKKKNDNAGSALPAYP